MVTVLILLTFELLSKSYGKFIIFTWTCSTNRLHVTVILFSNRSQIMSNIVGTKEKHMRCSRVCHWQSYHTLTSSMSCYCTDPQLNKIYLFQMIKKQNAVNGDVIYTQTSCSKLVYSPSVCSRMIIISISVCLGNTTTHAISY